MTLQELFAQGAQTRTKYCATNQESKCASENKVGHCSVSGGSKEVDCSSVGKPAQAC